MAGKQKPLVYDFLMSVDYALCHGPIHSFNELIFRDKTGWIGPATVDGATYIDKPKLFGGDDEGEGGVSGTVEFYRGTWLQRMSSSLARRFRLTPSTAPGYRGIAHVFFHGSRPPGKERIIRRLNATPVSSKYVGGFSNEDAVYETVMFEGPEAVSDAVFWHDSIDSGLVRFELFWSAINVTGGGFTVWDGGIAAEFRDGEGNILDGYASSAKVARFPEGKTAHNVNWPVPPLTREIRWRAASTRAIEEIEFDQMEIRAAAGQLVNHFGSNFEYAELDTGGSKGFRWSTNNPYFQGPKINATCAPEGLEEYFYVQPLIYPIIGTNVNGIYQIATQDSAFERDDYTGQTKFWEKIGDKILGEIFGPAWKRGTRYRNIKCKRDHLPDANPAVMIFDCMSNSEWGKGDPVSAFDTESYALSARTLQDENFGLSLLWNGQDKIESFVGEVLDHIRAMQFQHPRTGLWTLKLLRDDYNPDECKRLDESNCKVTNIKTRLWGETINEVRVSYTNPLTEEEETVSAQNLANIAIQGGVISDTRDYHGIRNPWLAKIVAERDVAEASATLTSCEVEVARSEGDIIPGDVVHIDWPRHGLVGYFRVNEIDPGSSRSKSVKLQVVEDIFSIQGPSRAVVPQPLPVDSDALPPADPNQKLILSAPYASMQNSGDAGIEYPLNRLAITAADTDRNYLRIDVQEQRVTSTGGQEYVSVSSVTPKRPVALGVTLGREGMSTLPAAVVEAVLDLDVAAGRFLVIGESDARHEIVLLTGYAYATDEWQIARGVYDTIPQDWDAAALIWDGAFLTGPLATGTYEEDQATEFFFLPAVGNDQLDIRTATPTPHVVVERASAPLRPANVSIAGNGFAHTYYSQADVPLTIPLTWANRNRLAEDSVIPKWTDANVTPEAGQTTTIRFWGGENFDVLDFEATGLTGTSYALNTADLTGFGYYEVEFTSVRDGIESFQPARVTLEMGRLGYGNNYDFDYGENDGAAV